MRKLNYFARYKTAIYSYIARRIKFQSVNACTQLLLLLSLSSSLALPAYAVVNGFHDTPTNNEAVCVVVPSGVCTGTLIGASFVVTAGHCISRRLDRERNSLQKPVAITGVGSKLFAV